MSASRHIRLMGCAAMAVCAMSMWGCSSGARLEVLSQPEPTTRRELVQQFDRGFYGRSHQGPYNNLVLVLQSRTPRQDDPVQITEQTLVIHMDWIPVASKTQDNPSTTSARLLWIIRTGESVIGYEGSGFVYVNPVMKKGVARGDATGTIDSSNLRATRGDVSADVLGTVYLNGKFRCDLDSATARRLSIEAERAVPPAN